MVGFYVVAKLRPVWRNVIKFVLHKAGFFDSARPAPELVPRDMVAKMLKTAGQMRFWSYRIFVLFGILPVLSALALDLYVLFPLKYGVSSMTPVFYAAEAW